MKQAFLKAMILVAVIFMDILGGSEVDLFVPSFPELKSHFNLLPIWVEALLSVNFIGYCIGLFFVGSLADKYGRKPIILIGLIVFIIGSWFCLYATSYKFLLAGRFFQGLGVAAPAILCFLIIADTYPLKKQQYLMAMLNSLVNVTIGAAPVVGSYITIYFHWQGNFVALLILGIITFLLTIFFIPSYKLPQQNAPSLSKGYIKIFTSKPLLLLITNIISTSAPYWIFVGISPLLYMENFGVSLKEFGFYQGSLALFFAIGSLFVGFLINKYDQKKMLYISNIICIFGLISIALVTLFDSASPLLITIALNIFIIGTIIPNAIIYPLSLNFMPEIKGKVSATMQAIRLVITAIGLEIAGYFYIGTFQNIGIIITVLVSVMVISLSRIIKNKELMNFSME